MSVLLPWVETLTYMQQSVLITATREAMGGLQVGQMKRIMLDIDGVLADFTTSFLHLAEVYYPEARALTAADQMMYGAVGTVSLWDDRVWALLKATPWWWTSLKPLVGIDTFRRIGTLSRDHEVYFITNRMHDIISPVEQTAAWLRQQGIPHPSVICTPFKGQACDLLKIGASIEDKFENAEDIMRMSTARSYLINRPWNQDKSNWLITRVDTVHEFLDRVTNEKMEGRHKWERA